MNKEMLEQDLDLSQRNAADKQQEESDKEMEAEMEVQGKSKISKQNVRRNILLKKKTELCKNYQFGKKCIYEDKCQYAHGMEELRSNSHLKHKKYKQKACKNYHEQGFCSYGKRCSYIHKQVDIQSGYTNQLESRRKRHVPRLPIFYEIQLNFINQNYQMQMQNIQQQKENHYQSKQDRILLVQ